MGATTPEQFKAMLASSAPTPVGVFPDNWSIVQCFISLRTQWRVGMNGATGLDYNVLPMIFRLHRIPSKAQRKVLSGLQIMEAETLEVLRESAD